ncbi:site-specific integrase [Variovorax sp. NFACC27]|uniref:tyrosine-type recombinase/integrase n=1 Tax=unclassified Variovorax TaxID=663243 RepID=UPI000898D205|nr:site-specific integrase [Variovorax sp. YR750]MDP9606542.1 integrase [Variovorax paradoxus]SEF33693.1 Site-specific recombinase XerD [Variovorax sp. NFACC28]SEG96492.1 Site-specific recombinase XerD [Variovorax sp. NFACC29]SFD98219.1 Site-specific recombinase XerD [Variovorax sp. NFACC26]SFH14568.1 Site-specific recombinase XerD [Variovorax sp. NFACC27]
MVDSTLPLFDEMPPAGQVAAFKAAFDAWLADQRGSGLLRQDGSVAVYEDMWEAFAAWCLGQSPVVTLSSLDLADLQAFQSARFGRKSSDLSLTPRYALRLMRLIDRVLRHHASRTEAVANPAAADWIAANPEIRYADAAHADPLPEYLSVSEARQLIAFLSSARPRPGKSRDAQAPLTWQEVRNRASVGLQLGAGLTPGDVRALTLDSPVSQGSRVRERPWKLQVPGNGNSPARETPVAPWAAELLQHWLVVRTEAGIAGTFLFPSTRTGKQWQKPSQYECAKRVLEEAGADSREGGSFRLRHTFALRQLRRGTSPQQVAGWLGIEPSKMKRYERVLPGVIEVV